LKGLIMSKTRAVKPTTAAIRKTKSTFPPSSEEVLRDEDGPIADVQDSLPEIDEALTTFRRLTDKIATQRKKSRDIIGKLSEERKAIKESLPDLFRMHKVQGTYIFEWNGKNYETLSRPGASMQEVED